MDEELRLMGSLPKTPKRTIGQVRSASRKVSGDPRWYPNAILAGDFGKEFNKDTIDFLNSDRCILPSSDRSHLNIAEFGIWRGATSLMFAEFLNHQGKLHLFDYEDNVASVAHALKAKGFTNVESWGSSYRYLDSYNWPLMKLLTENSTPIFDYVYLDGAHTWAIDALTFLLCDLLLKPGGYVDFDDYAWTLRDSSLDPSRVPDTGRMYTEEQIDAPQVKLIVDLLVKRNSSYSEILENKIFQKSDSGASVERLPPLYASGLGLMGLFRSWRRGRTVGPDNFGFHTSK
jgi:predicted O-methyltransferase YrrM